MPSHVSTPLASTEPTDMYALPNSLSLHTFEQVNIIQISDLHLHHVPADKADPSVQGLLQTLQYLQQHRENIDLIVVTGDLVHDTSVINYDYIFQQLLQLNIPFICQAGNHDVTQELDIELPFAQRRHVAVLPDSRLVAYNHAIDTPAWRLLFLNSAWLGEIAGFYDNATLTWVKNQLHNSEKPCVIFTHHPSWSIQSRWIDAYQLKNHKEFWHTIQPNLPKLKAIFSGHVHQESHFEYQQVQLYTVPSTGLQFLPHAEDFTIDTQRPAGVRQITLYNNATLETTVKRMDTR